MSNTVEQSRIAKVLAVRTPKAPVQQRSIERVEVMLDAAERLVAIHGTSGVTINEIATESGINRASVYQFFPSILAVWRGLALRYLADLQAQFDYIVAEHTYSHWHGAWDALIDTAANYYNENPVPRSVLLGTDGARDLRVADPDYDKRYAEWISETFGYLAQNERGMDVKYLRVIVTMTTSVFSLSVWEHGTITSFYTDEAKRMSRAYTEQLMQELDGPLR